MAESEVLDRLLSRGGMDSMVTTLGIIIGAVTLARCSMSSSCCAR